jgi:hypothetical protein
MQTSQLSEMAFITKTKYQLYLGYLDGSQVGNEGCQFLV